jgi:hypothetical protein
LIMEWELRVSDRLRGLRGSERDYSVFFSGRITWILRAEQFG